MGNLHGGNVGHKVNKSPWGKPKKVYLKKEGKTEKLWLPGRNRTGGAGGSAVHVQCAER